MFKYLKEGASLEDAGTIHRLEEASAAEWLEMKLENGEPKFHEVSFSDWSFPEEWKQEGRLIDPQYGELDTGTGEPIVVETLEPVVDAETGVEKEAV